jgi:hypothetical protein
VVEGPGAELLTMPELPEYIAVGRMTLACPRCNAEPGEVCEVLPANGLEIVHVERIKAAATMDLLAKKRNPWLNSAGGNYAERLSGGKPFFGLRSFAAAVFLSRSVCS